MENSTFVKDNFYVDGIILCKYISSQYSEELKQKIGKEKLKFDLVDDAVNNSILNYLKSKELYFLKKTMESTQVKFPLKIKTFLGDNSKKSNEIILEQNGTIISDKITNVSLKVGIDMNNKNIKHLKSTTKLSIVDLMELIKSENLKLRIQIKCGAVYKDDCLYISGTLTKISLEQSKMAQILTEIKEKEKGEKVINLLPKDKLFISNYPTKAKTVSDNIVSILINSDSI